MIRGILTLVALALGLVLLQPEMAVADNCSGLQDCYGSARAAAGAAAGMALMLGLAVLAAPALLRGALTRTESKPRRVGRERHVSALHGAPIQAIPGATDRDPQDSAQDEARDDDVEVPEMEEEPLRFDEKVRVDMAVRGWTPQAVAELARRPAQTMAVWDRRHNLDGSQAGQQATAFISADGRYVVVNNVTHDVVSVGVGPLDGWHSGPLDSSWTEALRGQVAAHSRAPDVRFAGPELCYPVHSALIAVDWCQHMGIRILGLEGLVLTEERLLPRLELVLDCSMERNPHGAATVVDCAERAREQLWEWSMLERCFVVPTLERK
jgi:hypothetical protein